MASLAIHICIANEINKVIKRNSNELLIGTMAPDISKLVGETKLNSHFLNSIDNDVPNLAKFLNKYGNYLDDDFVLGYYIHICVDYLWFKYFIPSITGSITDYKQVKKLDGTVEKYEKQTFDYYVYSDYANLNVQLLEKYDFPMYIFNEEIPNMPNIISEVPMDRLDLIVNSAKKYFEKGKVSKSHVFEINGITMFIERSKELILEEIKKLYEKNPNYHPNSGRSR